MVKTDFILMNFEVFFSIILLSLPLTTEPWNMLLLLLFPLRSIACKIKIVFSKQLNYNSSSFSLGDLFPSKLNVPGYPLMPSRFSDSDANMVFWEISVQIILPPDSCYRGQSLHTLPWWQLYQARCLVRAFQDPALVLSAKSILPTPYYTHASLRLLTTTKQNKKHRICGLGFS